MPADATLPVQVEALGILPTLRGGLAGEGVPAMNADQARQKIRDLGKPAMPEKAYQVVADLGHGYGAANAGDWVTTADDAVDAYANCIATDTPARVYLTRYNLVGGAERVEDVTDWIGSLWVETLAKRDRERAEEGTRALRRFEAAGHPFNIRGIA